MNKTALKIRDEGRSLGVLAPTNAQEELTFSIPEFYGKVSDRPFSIVQPVIWTDDGKEGMALGVTSPLSVSGVLARGSIQVTDTGDIELLMTVQNHLDHPVEGAWSTLHLDLSELANFKDEEGERTFLYTNVGWATFKQLLDPSSINKPIRIGASYKETTIIWRLITRTNNPPNALIGLAVDKGQAFASDHSKWPKGLLASHRWGTLAAGAGKKLKAKIYFCRPRFSTSFAKNTRMIFDRFSMLRLGRNKRSSYPKDSQDRSPCPLRRLTKARNADRAR